MLTSAGKGWIFGRPVFSGAVERAVDLPLPPPPPNPAPPRAFLSQQTHFQNHKELLRKDF